MLQVSVSSEIELELSLCFAAFAILTCRLPDLCDSVEHKFSIGMGPFRAGDRKYAIIVEHLDPELEDWQALEYQCIAEECKATNFTFLLSGLQSATEKGNQLGLPASNLTERSVESVFSSRDERQRVCLLDPKATLDLSTNDAEEFDVFLFGGILGDDPPRGTQHMNRGGRVYDS